MGVDLEMLLVLPDNHMDAREVLRRSVRLSRLIGPEHFHIVGPGEGWLADQINAFATEKGIVLDPATRAFISGEHHAMSIVPPWSCELSMIDYGDEVETEYYGRAVFHQDGEPKVAEPGEQFIKLHWFMRYYGEGYERGDWKTIREAIRHIRSTFPASAEVWMGGDSSGICLERIDDDRLAALEHHYQTVGHEPYVQGMSRFSGVHEPDCPVCCEPMANYGWTNDKGRRFAMVTCTGCERSGLREEASGEHVIAKLERSRDLFGGPDSNMHVILFDLGKRGWVKRSEVDDVRKQQRKEQNSANPDQPPTADHSPAG